METKFGFIHYWKYFKENFKISFKELIEFKSNLYSTLILSIAFFVITLLFGYVAIDSIFSSIGWTFTEFLLFSFLINVFNDVIGIFWYGEEKNLPKKIKEGSFNSYLVKPGSPFLLYVLGSGYNPILFTFMDIIYHLIAFQIIGGINYFYLFVGFLLTLILAILGTLFIHFLISFSWLLLELGSVLVNNVYWETLQHEASRYLFQFFSNSNFFSKLMLFLPMSYVSILIIPIIITGNFSMIQEYIVEILIFSIILYLGIRVLWHYGLKKYEAFG